MKQLVKGFLLTGLLLCVCDGQLWAQNMDKLWGKSVVKLRAENAAVSYTHLTLPTTPYV